MKQEAEYKGRDFDLIKTDWLRNKNKINSQNTTGLGMHSGARWVVLTRAG